MNWTPMEKKLPPYEKRVLVCDDTGEIYLEKREDVDHYSLGKQTWLEAWRNGEGTQLIAWMPLPAAPKKLCKFFGDRYSFDSPLVGPWQDSF